MSISRAPSITEPAVEKSLLVSKIFERAVGVVLAKVANVLMLGLNRP